MLAEQNRLDLTLRQIYDAAVGELSEVVDTSNMYIALYDDQSKMIQFPLAYENGVLIPDSERAVERPYAPRQLGVRSGLTEWIIQSRMPLLIEKDFERWLKKHPDVVTFPMGTRCWLGAPMELRGRVVGVIGFQNFQREGVFDNNHLNLLVTIARQIAIAIDNMRLLESMSAVQVERQRRLELLALISQRMAEAAVDPDSVLELVVRAAKEVTTSDLTSLFEYDERTGAFLSGVRLNRDDEIQHLTKQELLDTEGMVAEVAANQMETFEEDASSKFAQEHGIRAYAALPLTVSAMEGVLTTVGVLVVNFRDPHSFSDDAKEILHHLATQAAIAIAYAAARSSAFANEQLAALGQAAATLQHRLGNTINITLPAVMRLRYRIGNDPEIGEILDAIERNTLFANEVIRRMQMPLRPEPFKLTSVNGLLREAILNVTSETDRYSNVRLVHNLQNEPLQSFDDVIQLPQIRVQANLQDNLPETHMGVARMSEVFRVLVENAVKAIYPNSGEVVVTSSLSSSGHRRVIEVMVTDNGKGIEDAVRTKLFQQPVPRKEFGQGAGLGLWLSRIIVRSHQGDIDIRWTTPGKGSCFYVRLPILIRPPVQVSESGGLT